MKKTTILLALVVFTVSSVFAQKSLITNAEKYKEEGKLEEALTTINKAIDPNNEKVDKTISLPETWIARGDIFHAISKSTDASVKALSDDPLSMAVESYKKAIEVDTKNKKTNILKVKLLELTSDFTNNAIDAFSLENYGNALKSFEQILDINNISILKADDPDFVDTVIIFNAGLAAYNAGKFDKAIKYYEESAKYGYNGARIYPLISTAFTAKGDTVGALDVLKKGFEIYPDEKTILEGMIQIFISLDQADEAMKYLQVAIDKDPEAARYRAALGSLYEDLGNEEKAVESYEKTLTLDDENFIALFNLGAIYYNKGVEQFNVAADLPLSENEKYEAETAKADEWFKKAIPYMEKCYEQKPTDYGTLQSLKTLYRRINQMDKYNEVVEKIEQLNN